MQDNHSDRFEAAKRNPFESINSKDNFFMNESVFQLEPIKLYSGEAVKRLNDYDITLLEEDAYKNVKDEIFQLEYKISKLENELKILEIQISAAQDLNDEDLLKSLFSKKEVLTDEYKYLFQKYNASSISARISGNVSRVWSGKFINNKKSITKPLLKKILKFIESNLPKNITALIELKKSLGMLENINKNVNDLVSRYAPFGEELDKYDKLSKYILKANTIQSNIEKGMKQK